MTAWCANQKPNHFLKVLFMFSVYFNYTAMLFPFLLSMLRLIPLYKPFNHDKLCARIVRISTPLIFIYPFLFCFPLVVALGECRQLQGSYQFGAIYIYYDRSLFNLKQAITLFLNVIFWFLVSTVTNGILYAKLRKLRKTTSVKLQRAELSLTFLTFSMLSAYITNLAFVSFIYILADYSTIRLPSTGILTSWCSSQQPNHGLKILYFLSVYLNYIALLFPFLLSILRSLPVFYPIRVSELCARIVRIGTPIMFIYPFLFCFPLFPALGDCRQLLGSYPFGSIYIYWSQSLFDAVAIFHPSSSVYLVAIRPYGNDCDFVLVPWIFYSTHPIFKIEKTESNGTARRVLTL
uniref:Serpentine receptor class gamma n=1 Tax=Caenorhabditis tropicalis TaxID=1561998 RepID=A0A1I7UW65_9PELO